LKLKDFNAIILVLNIHGPYSNQIRFLEELASTSAFKNPYTIIKGDLNFTIVLHKVWGMNPHMYPQR